MTLSSNTLFHFTDTIDALTGILIDEFRPRYALEDLGHTFGRARDERDPTIGIPMVCFCDIPLSQTIDHVQTYGNYALGLTKDWGMRSSVAPVIYSDPEGGTAKSILDLYERADPDPPGGRDAPASLADSSSDLFAFSSRKGRFHRRGKPARHVKFYDEPEWRYVRTHLGRHTAGDPLT